jgi:hypothetical protein
VKQSGFFSSIQVNKLSFLLILIDVELVVIRETMKIHYKPQSNGEKAGFRDLAFGYD